MQTTAKLNLIRVPRSCAHAARLLAALVLCVATLSDAAHAAALTYTAVSAIGNGVIRHPFGLAVDSQGRVFVGDENDQTIYVFDATGVPSTTLGPFAESSGPYGMCFDRNNNFYVGDLFKNSILIRNSSTGSWTSLGINSPGDIRVDSSGYIYVASLSVNAIQKFDSNGGFVRQWTSAGTSAPLAGPASLELGPDGSLYVLDSGLHRVVIYDANGDFVRTFGSNGQNPGQFSSPNGIALDKAGRVLVADTGNQRVQVLSAEGVPLSTLSTVPAEFGGALQRPERVAVSPSGLIYVTDNDTGRVVVFRLDPSSAADIDLDGSVGAVDIQLVINAALDIDIAPKIADVDSDGDVDAVDVQLVINAVLA